MAEKEKNNELENMSFEDAINELEKIVDELEGNEISLDEACLLYTSPSPRDKTVSRMPSSA